MLLQKILKYKKIATELAAMPEMTIALGENQIGKNLFGDFTLKHSKIFFISQKTIGVAIINLTGFSNADEYLQSVNGKNSASYFSRKALRAGYNFKQFNPNYFADEIFEINTSAEKRQGRTLDDSYREKITNFTVDKHFQYYGVFSHEKLVAYLGIIYSGELALMNRIIGHAKHLDKGVMYLLVTSYIKYVMESELEIKSVMYDTYFGAKEGLKLFKTRCGFIPCKIKWALV